MRNSRSPTEQGPWIKPEEEESYPNDSSSEEGEGGRPFQSSGGNKLDFRVDVPKFEGQLDSNLFLDWLRTVERVFDSKDILDEKKVKLVALKLCKYASIWWANLMVKRARKGKGNIRTWVQMRDKLKAKFLPTHYLYDNYLKLCNLKQGTKRVEEYPRDFEQLLLKCDLKEDETQTRMRYLSGLDDQIAHVTPLMILAPLYTKWNNNGKSREKGLCQSPLLGLTLFKDPQTQILDHKLPHLHGQTHLMSKTCLKETLPKRMTRGDAFDVKG